MSEREQPMTLSQLRRALGKTQANVAAALEVGQDVVSRLERRPGLRIDTLRRYVQALGADCAVEVRVPGRRPIAIREGVAPSVGRRRRKPAAPPRSPP